MMRIVSAACRLVVFVLTITWATGACAQTLAEQEAVMGIQAGAQAKNKRAPKRDAEDEAEAESDGQNAKELLKTFQTDAARLNRVYLSFVKIVCYCIIFILTVGYVSL